MLAGSSVRGTGTASAGDSSRAVALTQINNADRPSGDLQEKYDLLKAAHEQALGRAGTSRHLEKRATLLIRETPAVEFKKVPSALKNMIVTLCPVSDRQHPKATLVFSDSELIKACRDGVSNETRSRTFTNRSAALHQMPDADDDGGPQPRSRRLRAPYLRVLEMRSHRKEDFGLRPSQVKRDWLAVGRTGA
jgi:hypothetical protein